MAFLMPLISLIYLIETLTRKRFKIYLKIPMATFAFVVLIFDVFVSLVFYVNCFDVTYRYGYSQCIGWIYPTIDFKIMLVLSLLILLTALYGTIKSWGKNTYYFLGTGVLYLGMFTRLFILVGASEAMVIAESSSNPIVYEIFSVVIVYGLLSAAIYFTVFCIGIFRPRTPLRQPV